MDFSANHILITRNSLKNSVYISDGNHNDGFQGQAGYCLDSGAEPYCIYDAVVLTGNTFIFRDIPAASLPLCTTGGNGTQGMSAFDEVWTNLVVSNNILIGDATHMLDFYSAQDANVINNVAITYQQVHGFCGGAGIYKASHQVIGSGSLSAPQYPLEVSKRTTVRNNIVTCLGDDTAESTYVYDHNLVLFEIGWNVPASAGFNTTPGTYNDQSGHPNVVTATSQTAIFNTVDFVNGTFTVTLKTASIAFGAGTVPAPARVDGTARVASPPPDQGAY